MAKVASLVSKPRKVIFTVWRSEYNCYLLRLAMVLFLEHTLTMNGCRAKLTIFYTYVNLRKFQKRLCLY